MVFVDVRRIDDLEEVVGHRRVPGRLDRHSPPEQRDPLARREELVLDRDPPLHAAVALGVVAEPPDRVEHPEPRRHGDGAVPGEQPRAPARLVAAALAPHVADAQGKMIGQALDMHRPGIGLRPVGRVSDEGIDLLRRLGEGGFGAGRD